MVSLSSFSKVTEEGVLFSSPFTGEETMLTPEESMRIQVIIACAAVWAIDLQWKSNTAFYWCGHYHATRRRRVFINNGASRGRSNVCIIHRSFFVSNPLIQV